jgi:hypothetical protein
MARRLRHLDRAGQRAVRIDQTKIKKALRSKEIHLRCGKVLARDEDAADGVVFVDLELWPDQAQATGILAPGYGGDGYGDFWLPAVGDLVLVANCSKHDNDLGELFVISGLWAPNRKKPSVSAANKRLMVIRDGDTLDIDISGGGELTINVVGGGNVAVETDTGDVQLTASAGTITLSALTVEGKSGGAAVALAKEADLQALETAYLAHKHLLTTPGVGSSGISDTVITPSTGTTVLKGE